MVNTAVSGAPLPLLTVHLYTPYDRSSTMATSRIDLYWSCPNDRVIFLVVVFTYGFVHADVAVGKALYAKVRLTGLPNLASMVYLVFSECSLGVSETA